MTNSRRHKMAVKAIRESFIPQQTLMNIDTENI